MPYIDYICIALCGLHLLFSIYERFRFKSRVESICSKCNLPVSDLSTHDCELTSTQLKALTAFVVALKDSKKEF